jgi:hypothetical protein
MILCVINREITAASTGRGMALALIVCCSRSSSIQERKPVMAHMQLATRPSTNSMRTTHRQLRRKAWTQTADLRCQAESMLRDMAFVYRLTQAVKDSIVKEKTKTTCN